MIRKAIIEEAISPTLYRIRIPELNGVKGYVFDTPFDQLQTATVCAPPNQIPNYLVKDVVFIAYEKDEDPVIIGKLLTNKEDDNTLPDVAFNSLKVNGEFKMGNTVTKDINNLSDTKGNIQKQIDNISSLLESVGGGGGGGSSTVGELDTTATTSQQTSSSESFSGNITLHKISKTGDYNDLLNIPSPPTDTNQKVKTSTVSFGNDASVEFDAGNNITISGDASNNTVTISATDTTYTAGNGIDITNGVISLDVPYASGNSF